MQNNLSADPEPQGNQEKAISDQIEKQQIQGQNLSQQQQLEKIQVNDFEKENENSNKQLGNFSSPIQFNKKNVKAQEIVQNDSKQVEAIQEVIIQNAHKRQAQNQKNVNQFSGEKLLTPMKVQQSKQEQSLQTNSQQNAQLLVERIQDQTPNQALKSVYERLSFSELNEEQTDSQHQRQMLISVRSQSEAINQSQEKLNAINCKQTARQTHSETNLQQMGASELKKAGQNIFSQKKSREEPLLKISQLSNEQREENSEEPNSQADMPLFTRAKSQEVVIDCKSFTRNENESCEQKQLAPSQNVQKFNKFSLINNFNLAISPLKNKEEALKIEPIQSASQMANKQEAAAQNKQTEEVKEQKHQPLDIKTLSVLGLSSPQATKFIKPPSPKGQKKLKPWQKVKKLKEKKQESIVSQPATTASVQISTSSILQKTVGSSIDPTNAIINEEKISSDVRVNSKDQVLVADENKTQQKEQVSLTQTLPIVKIQAKSEELQQFKKQFPYIKSFIPASSNDTLKNQKELKQKITQHSNTPIASHGSEHPLLRHHPLQVPKDIEKIKNEDQNEKKLNQPGQQTVHQHGLKEQIQNQLRQRLIKNQISKDNEVQEQNEMRLQRPLSQKKSLSSSSSVFQDDKLRRELQKKKRMQELEIEIRKRKNLSQQLELSTPIGVKLLLSLLAGVVIGGTSYILRKNKLGSLVLGVASGVSTFLLKK